VVLGDRVVKIDDDRENIRKVCEKPACLRRDKWFRADDRARINMAKAIGVGDLFIRETVPTMADFPAADMRWDDSAYIHGPVGTGKTWAASALACDALAQGRTVRLVNWLWFTAEVRDTYKAAGKETELDIVKRYTLPDVLCLDDIGTGKQIEGRESQAAIVLMYMLMNKRYEQNKITHITSNVEPDELASIYDPRIARRIAEMCEIVELSERI